MSKGNTLFGSLELERHKLNEQIAEIIQEMVQSQKLKIGDRLPPERQLADLFKVNRATVREAIHLLRERGLVERRNGQGTRIVSIPPATVGAAIERYFVLNNCSHRDLQEVRTVLEPKVAALAATNAARDDLTKLEGVLNQLEESWASRDYPRAASADAGFHLALANASHNPLVIAIFSGLSPMLERFLSLEHPVVQREESFRTHREIYEAVAARDPVRAAEAMHKHIRTTPLLD